MRIHKNLRKFNMFQQKNKILSYHKILYWEMFPYSANFRGAKFRQLNSIRRNFYNWMAWLPTGQHGYQWDGMAICEINFFSRNFAFRPIFENFALQKFRAILYYTLFSYQNPVVISSHTYCIEASHKLGAGDYTYFCYQWHVDSMFCTTTLLLCNILF